MLTLLPTDGRSYRTAKAAIEDLVAGEEFQSLKGTRCTIHMFPQIFERVNCISLFYDTINGGFLELQSMEDIH